MIRYDQSTDGAPDGSTQSVRRTGERSWMRVARFRNILDMIAKKADHSVLRLLQISQQHIESQLERVPRALFVAYSY